MYLFVDLIELLIKRRIADYHKDLDTSIKKHISELKNQKNNDSEITETNIIKTNSVKNMHTKQILKRKSNLQDNLTFDNKKAVKTKEKSLRSILPKMLLNLSKIDDVLLIKCNCENRFSKQNQIDYLYNISLDELFVLLFTQKSGNGVFNNSLRGLAGTQNGNTGK